MSDIQWLLDAIRTMGAPGAVVFAVLFWIERTERKACEKESKERLVQFLTTTSQVANSISDVKIAVSTVSGGFKDINGSLAQVEQLVRSLGYAIKKRGSA